MPFLSSMQMRCIVVPFLVVSLVQTAVQQVQCMRFETTEETKLLQMAFFRVQEEPAATDADAGDGVYVNDNRNDSPGNFAETSAAAVAEDQERKEDEEDQLDEDDVDHEHGPAMGDTLKASIGFVAGNVNASSKKYPEAGAQDAQEDAYDEVEVDDEDASPMKGTLNSPLYNAAETLSQSMEGGDANEDVAEVQTAAEDKVSSSPDEYDGKTLADLMAENEEDVPCTDDEADTEDNKETDDDENLQLARSFAATDRSDGAGPVPDGTAEDGGADSTSDADDKAPADAYSFFGANKMCRGQGWNVRGWPKHQSGALTVVECSKLCSSDPNCTAFDVCLSGTECGDIGDCWLFAHTDVTGDAQPGVECYKKVQAPANQQPSTTEGPESTETTSTTPSTTAGPEVAAPSTTAGPEPSEPPVPAPSTTARPKSSEPSPPAPTTTPDPATSEPPASVPSTTAGPESPATTASTPSTTAGPESSEPPTPAPTTTTGPATSEPPASVPSTTAGPESPETTASTPSTTAGPATSEPKSAAPTTTTGPASSEQPSAAPSTTAGPKTSKPPSPAPTTAAGPQSPQTAAPSPASPKGDQPNKQTPAPPTPATPAPSTNQAPAGTSACNGCDSSNAAWKADAGGVSCGARIEWLKNHGMDEMVAKVKVAITEYPAQCGACCTASGPCTGMNQDPYKTGKSVECCHGMQKCLSQWTSNGPKTFRCLPACPPEVGGAVPKGLPKGAIPQGIPTGAFGGFR